MLVALGFAMVALFMYLVMAKKATPIVVLILVPVVFGLFAGAGLGISDMIMEGLLNLAPTAGMMFFVIIYFGMMIDVGLFDPPVRWILRFVGHDPVRLVIGTSLLTSVISLDGDGSTTFMIVTAALLPLYLRLGLSPVTLTVVAALSNGVLNTLPWGGSTSRAAAALGLTPTEIFVPMIPAVIAGLMATLVLAWMLGRAERKRIGSLSLGREDDTDTSAGPTGGSPAGAPATDAGPQVSTATSLAGVIDRPNARPRLLLVNLLLTVTVMTVLVADVVEPAALFMVATALALVINFRRVESQLEQIQAHSSSVIAVVGMIFAASVLTGVMNGTGMISAMAEWLVGVIPASWGPFMATIAGVLSIPLTFVLTNDAFYFGILPILAETAGHYGISPVEVARASLVGQALHQSSPLVASFLLLIGFAKVNMGQHLRMALWRGSAVALVMLVTGGLVGVYPLL
ncbi:citrate:proton symporter [Nocardiopsis sp. NPDC006198]|uniref:CitMHS family transporter n=1 Tax=Nocardiopsis sp. NPDC006198 TaxID=3154472 RepID=UPI0033B7C19C